MMSLRRACDANRLENTSGQMRANVGAEFALDFRHLGESLRISRTDDLFKAQTPRRLQGGQISRIKGLPGVR